MTDEQRAARAEKARAAKRRRAAERESRLRRLSDALLSRLDPEDQLKLTYVNSQLKSGREDDDVKLLREVRRQLLRTHITEDVFA